MRIAILAYNLRVAGGLSVGKNIINTLPTIFDQHRYLIIIPAGCGYPKYKNVKRVHTVNVPLMSLMKRIYFETFSLPLIIKKFRPDWIWALGNVGLVSPPCKQAILFHDTHLIYPESHYAFESFYYKLKKRILGWRLKQCLTKTQIVFCQTETTKKRFSECFNFKIHRIALCPNALSKFSQTEPPFLNTSLKGYENRFKLFVLAKCYGHKNIDGIIKMYVKHREKLKDTLCVLTISKDQHAIANSILERINQHGLEDLIINVGPLKQEEISGYFKACNALFLPTLLESFSGTYLEAMYFKRPIITSDLDFAHDVCGSAAQYCNPFDSQSMCDAILKVANSYELQQKLVAAGTKRISSLYLTWPDILGKVIYALEKLI